MNDKKETIPLKQLGIFHKITWIIILKDESSFKMAPDDLSTTWISYIAKVPRSLYQIIDDNIDYQAFLTINLQYYIRLEIIRESKVDLFNKHVLWNEYIPQPEKGVLIFLNLSEKSIVVDDIRPGISSIVISLKSNSKGTYFSHRQQDILNFLYSFLERNNIDFKSPRKPQNHDSLINFNPLFSSHINQCQSKDIFGLQQHNIRVKNITPNLREYHTLESIKNLESHTLPFGGRRLILVAPFVSPTFTKENTKKYHELIKLDLSLSTENKRTLKEFFDLSKVEQKNDYTHELAPNSGITIESMGLQMAIIERKKYLTLLDNMALLHSSFTLDAVVRLPYKSSSFKELLSHFSPFYYQGTKPDVFYEKLTSLGTQMHSDYPQQIMNALFAEEREIVAITDLPLEWMRRGDISLGFLSDVTRLPEIPARSLMSHYTQRSNITFEILKTPSRILVVYGADKDRHLEEHFNLVKTFCAKNTNVTFVEPNSIALLKEQIETLKPHVLIFYTHGKANQQNQESSIQIGDENLTNTKVVEFKIFAPLVVLIACETIPLYGQHNSIAQAFFELGTISFTGAVLPIEARLGSQFAIKLINQFNSACEKGIHKSWLEFISHTLRSLYFDEQLVNVAEHFARVNPSINRSKDFSAKTEWLLMLLTGDRKTAFENINSYISKCFSHPELVAQYLNSNKRLPETYFFSTWGRGDLVIFDEWRNNFIERLLKKT